MTKRILSLLLAFLILVSSVPVSALATDGDSTPVPETTEAAAVAETPCPTCGKTGCESNHENWCATCQKDSCGIDHSVIQAQKDPCVTCGKTDCESNHENWCATCQKDDCGIDHSAAQEQKDPCVTCGKTDCESNHENWCATCQKDDCGIDHSVIQAQKDPCVTCGKTDCESNHENWCATCQKDDCGIDHSAVQEQEIPCPTCGKTDCESKHENWCATCQKDDCGIDHSAVQEQKDPCVTCGKTDCESNHENWCAICEKDDCGEEHNKCETCGETDCESKHENWCAICEKDDCGEEHKKCKTCGETDCESKHENWCIVCLKDDCGEKHFFCKTCGLLDCESKHENWCKICRKDDCGEHSIKRARNLSETSVYRVNIGQKMTFNPTYIHGGSFFISADPEKETGWSNANALAGAKVSEDLVVVITNVYDNGVEYWYKVEAASGHVLPGAMSTNPWVFQNLIGDSPDYDSLLLWEEPKIPCEVCGKTDCTANHLGGTFIDQYGNQQTVVVEGSGIPEGAEVKVSVPGVNVGPNGRFFDIKILKEDGTEWQPIDDNTSVTVSIPVTMNAGSVDVYHFIDYAPAIHGGVEYMCTSVLDGSILNVLSGAIGASNVEGYVAVDVLKNIPVVDGFVKFSTSSFSVYELVNNEFIPSGQEKTIEFDNGLSGHNDLNTVVSPTYYATPDTEFNFQTTTIVTNSPRFDTYFTIKNGSDFVTRTEYFELSNEETGSGYTKRVKVSIDPNTPAGSSLKIAYATSGWLGSKGIVREIIIVRPVEIKFNANLDSSLATVTGLPDNREHSTVADNRVITDGKQAHFTIPDSIPAATPSDPNDEYTFLGWNTSPAGDGTPYTWNGTSFSPSYFVPTQNTELYAMWKRGECDVTFDYNNGTNTTETETVEYNSYLAMPAEPKRPGYIFMGWCASPDGTTKRYYPATEDKPADQIQVKSDVTLYALWGVELYIRAIGGGISLQKDGESGFTAIGTNNTYGFQVTSSTSGGVTTNTYYVVAPENAYADAYFKFTPSGTNKTIKGSSIGSQMEFLKAIGTTNTLTGDVRISSAGLTEYTYITFSAENKCIVTFDTKGGSSIDSLLVDSGSNVNPNSYTTSREGYDFGGWFDSDGNKVTGNYSVTRDTTFTARWTPHKYNVTLTAGTGIASVTGGGEKDYSSLVTVSAVLESGYSFVNWTENNAPASAASDYSFLMPSRNVSLKANAQPVNYTISYDLGGGTVSGTNPTGYTVESGAITLINPTKNGYTFTGWTGTGLSEATVSATIPTGSTGDRAYTATWQKDNYTITYDTRGVGTVAPAQYSVTDEITVAAPSVPVGYTFSGWKVTSAEGNWLANGTHAADSVIDAGKYGNVTLTAQWLVPVNVLITDESDTTAADGTIAYSIPGFPSGTQTNALSLSGVSLGTGAGATVTVTPAEHYEIIEVDGTPYTGDQYVYTVGESGLTAPVNIVLKTARKSYTITYILDDGIANSVDSLETSKLYGDTLTINFVPKSGRSLIYAEVNGSDIGTINPNRYHFSQTIVGNTTIKVRTQCIPYTIGYNLNGGTVNGTNPTGYTVESDAITLVNPSKTGHTFTGWTGTGLSEASMSVTIPTGSVGHREYTANFTINKYKIEFVNEDGTVLQTGEVEYNKMPAYTGTTPQKQPTAEHSYTFAGWTPQPIAVTRDATYTATYTAAVRSYTVTWVDGDGNTLKTNTWQYGVKPVYSGATPTKTDTAQYSYTFNQKWMDADGNRLDENTVVAGDVTYQAQFDSAVKQYTVTWYDGDGILLKTEQLAYGATPAYDGAVPTKAATAEHSYTFNQTWSPAVASVTGDASYTAQFDSTVNKYTITWVDGDGKTIKTEQVAYGETPAYTGDEPTKTATTHYAYTFNNTWTPAIVPVTEPATYTAQFTEERLLYTVIWWQDLNDNDTMDADEVLETDEVPYNSKASYNGTEPSKEATQEYWYHFEGWTGSDGTIAKVGTEVTVTGDISYQAVLNPKLMKYNVIWMVNGVVVETTPWEYGQTPVYQGTIPTKPADDNYTYIWDPVTPWTPEITPVVDEVIYEALFVATAREFTITYSLNTDAVTGTVTGTNPVEYTIESEDITLINPVPDKPYYRFAGWSGTDIIGTAMEVTIPKGSRGDRAYTATYELIEYQITFDTNGAAEETVVARSYTYGADVTLPEVTKTGYTYTWKAVTNNGDWVAGTAVESGVINRYGDVTLKAEWTAIPYSIRFHKNAEDATGEMQDLAMLYDEEKTLTENAFARPGFQFAGWATAADSEEIVYTDGFAVKNLTETKDEIVELYAVWEINLVSLLITTENTVDGSQTYVFDVTGTGKDGTDVRLQVAMGAHSQKKIVGLPAGSYTISDENGWSWRFDHQSETHDVLDTTYIVEFDYTYDHMNGKTRWLNGYSN